MNQFHHNHRVYLSTSRGGYNHGCTMLYHVIPIKVTPGLNHTYFISFHQIPKLSVAQNQPKSGHHIKSQSPKSTSAPPWAPPWPWRSAIRFLAWWCWRGCYFLSNNSTVGDSEPMVDGQQRSCWKTHIYTILHIWGFPKMGIPKNWWFIWENLIKMEDLGVPLF